MSVGKAIEQMQTATVCRYLAAGIRHNGGLHVGMRENWLWRAIADFARGHGSTLAGVVLHYSGYGYSSNGSPEWLADALANRPPWASHIRIVTFFHELYANGWPWRRAFWQSSLQRRVAISIAKSSDALLTNRAESAAWLEQVTGRPLGSVKHLPVPSNVGEPVEVPEYLDRAPQAVVFGNANAKRSFVQGVGAIRVARVCQEIGISRLVDIGSSIAISRKPFDNVGVEVEQLGYLRSEDVSHQLLQSRIGFFDYFPHYLTKSGVLAAFLSHGVFPIGSNRTHKPLKNILHPFISDPAMPSLSSMPSGDQLAHVLQAFSEAARMYYRQHTVSIHGSTLAGMFLPAIDEHCEC